MKLIKQEQRQQLIATKFSKNASVFYLPNELNTAFMRQSDTQLNPKRYRIFRWDEPIRKEIAKDSEDGRITITQKLSTSNCQNLLGSNSISFSPNREILDMDAKPLSGLVRNFPG